MGENGTAEFISDPTDIKWIISDYCVQLYSNKYDLDEMDKFAEIYNLTKLLQEIKILTFLKEVKFLI